MKTQIKNHYIDICLNTSPVSEGTEEEISIRLRGIENKLRKDFCFGCIGKCKQDYLKGAP